MVNIFQSVDIERRQRFAALATDGAGATEHFMECSRHFLGKKELETANTAIALATSLKYTHGNLSSEAYLAHPLRVAEILMQVCTDTGTDGVVIALLHNVLEVTELSLSDLRREFGSKVASSIATLTVDRARQHDLHYKEAYYNAINNSYPETRIVKALDKLDNLFMLCANPDDEIRKKYIAEVERYILPIFIDLLPELVTYFKEVLRNAEQVGYEPDREI